LHQGTAELLAATRTARSSQIFDRVNQTGHMRLIFPFSFFFPFTRLIFHSESMGIVAFATIA
jgi:hypothetical protein